MPLPAFSNISLSNYNARLKWATNFGTGQSLGAWTEIAAPSVMFRSTFSGTDAVSGFSAADAADFFGPHDFNFQALVERTSTGSELAAVIQATDCPAVPAGSRELYITASNVARDPAVLSYPQAYLYLSRTLDVGETIPAHIDRIYHCAYFKTPATLKTMLKYPTSSANYYNILDWKTGWYGSNASYGDYRISATIMENPAGTLYWRMAGDNNANGWNQGSIESGMTTYWSTPSAPQDDSIQEGEWYKIEVEVIRPTRSTTRTGAGGSTDPYEQDTTTGSTVGIITRVSTGVRQVICNQVGGQQYGNENLPFTRFHNAILYSGGGAGDGAGVCLTAAWTGLEFWDKAPYILI